MPQNCAPRSGYTLVELSIVIIIISLLTASGLAVGASMVDRAAYIDTNKQLDQIDQSIKDFYVVHGRLPCVARLDTLPGASTFGAEIYADCTSTTTAPTSTWRHTNSHGGNDYPIRIGMVPTRALGLPDSAAGDKYGNRIIYAVTEALTSSNSFGASDGGVFVNDAGGNRILSSGAYFLVSPGRDRKGAYAYNTAALLAGNCTTSTNLDAANCNFSNAVFRDAPFNSGDVANQFFDDITRWTPKYQLSAGDTSNSALWSGTAGTNVIYSTGPNNNVSATNVGIGLTNPGAKLEVNGMVDTDGPQPEVMRVSRTSSGAQRLAFTQGHAGHLVHGYSSVNNAKPLIFHVTTNSTNTTPTAGYNGFNVRIRGTDVLRLTDDGNGWLAGTLAEASDTRLKKDITPLENALEKLTGINGVYYRWNGADGRATDDDLYMGILAQDVEAAFPEAVTTQEDGYLAVDKSALIAPIIEAIKELKAENARLRSELEAVQTANTTAEPNNPTLGFNTILLYLLTFAVLVLLIRKR